MITDKTETLLRGLFAIDEKGNTYLRVCGGTPQGELKNAVSTQSNRSFETLLNNAIVLDENGCPAIRLAEVQYGMTVQEKDNARRLKMEAEKAERLAPAVSEEE